MSGGLGDRHWQMLTERMREAYEQRRDQLAQGYATDFADYNRRVGYIDCLREITVWSNDIIESMDARPPQARNA